MPQPLPDFALMYHALFYTMHVRLGEPIIEQDASLYTMSNFMHKTIQ